MSPTPRIPRLVIAIALVLSTAPAAFADSAAPMDDEALRAELARLEAQIFESAFVTCDIEAMRAVLTDDFEFYHDQGGLTATSGDDFVAKTRNGCSKRDLDAPPPMQRILHPDSVTLERLGPDHALQFGRHDFTELQADGSYAQVSTARFIHIWRLTEDGWKLSREVSHEHR